MANAIGLSSKVAVAVRALQGVISDKSSEEAYSMLGAILGDKANPPVRGTSNYLEAYNQMPWLKASANRISDSVAQTNWHLYAVKDRRSGKFVKINGIGRAPLKQRQKFYRLKQESGELIEITAHPLLDLLTTANDYFIGLTNRKLTQIHLDLVGEAFWLKERNIAHVPNSVWPIPPHWVKSTPSPSNRFYHLEFGNWRQDVPDTEILWMMHPNPAQPYGRGRGTAQSLGDELETDEYAAKHVKTWFFNRARPDVIVSGKFSSKTDAERLERQWLDKNKGFWNAFKPFFLNAEGVTVQQLTQSFEQMQLVPLRQYERDTIIQVFGVPPEILGIIANSNRATIDASDYLYSRWVILPRLEFLRSNAQERLVPEYDDRLLLEYDPPVLEDKEYQLNAAKAAPHTLRINEWRRLAGQDDLDDEKQGNSFAVPINIEILESLEPSTGGDITVRDIQPETKLLKSGKSVISKELVDEISAIADKLDPKMRIEFIKAVNTVYSHASLDDIINAYATGRINEIIAAARVRELEETLDNLEKLLRQGLDLAGTATANDLSETLEIDFEFDGSNPDSVKWADNHAGDLIKDISKKSQDAIKEIVRRSQEGEYDTREAAERIKSVIGLTPNQATAVDSFRNQLIEQGVTGDDLTRRVARYRSAQLTNRARTIARTESITAANQGQLQAWKQARSNGFIRDSDVRKEWIVTPDDLLDTEYCEPSSGQRRKINENFSVGGIKVNAPPAHPNCRCAMGLVFIK